MEMIMGSLVCMVMYLNIFYKSIEKLNYVCD